jgi:hypothetical protein
MKNPILLDLPASIESSRLLLRPPQSGDGTTLHEAIVESLPELGAFASLRKVAEDQTRESAGVFCRMPRQFPGPKGLPF